MNIFANIRFFIVIIFMASNSLFSTETGFVKKWQLVNIPNNPNIGVDLNNNVYLDVYFLKSNPQYGWICGFNSIVLRTSDGGNSWSSARISGFGNMQLESINFLDENIGYCSGPNNNDNSGNIFKSTDGGVTWKDISPIDNLSGLTPSLWGNYFLDQNTGWVIGGDCKDFGAVSRLYFFKTTDGGNSWKKFQINETRYNTKLSDLIVFPSGFGYAVSSGYLLVTNNFGDSWEFYSKTGGEDWQEDVAIFNNSILLPYDKGCSGDSQDQTGGMRFSSDYGVSWLDTDLKNDMYGALLINDSTGWGVGRGGQIYITSDYGKTWKSNNFCINEDFVLDDVYYIDEDNIWVVGDKIYRIYNAPIITDTNYVNINLCKGEPFEVDFGLNYQIEWEISNSKNRKIVLNYDEDINFKAIGKNADCPDTIITKYYDVNFEEEPNFDLFQSQDTLCENQGSYNITKPDNIVFKYWENLLTNEKIYQDSLEVSQSGKFRIYYSSTFGCDYSEDFDVTFAQFPDPTITNLNFTNFCIGDTSYLELNKEFFKYEWKKKDDDSFSEFGKIFNATETGEYYVIAENEFGCIDTSNFIKVDVLIDTNRFDFRNQISLDFRAITSPDVNRVSCGWIILRNNSWKAAEISNLYLTNNTEFSIPASQFPIVIAPFSVDSINVCFKSDTKLPKTDSIVIEDVCYDVILPIDALVDPIDYSSDTRCNLDVFISNYELFYRYEFYYNPPFPNPASNFISIDFVEFDPEKNNFPVKASLFDMFGVEKSTAILDITTQKDLIAGKLLRATMNFDTSTLESGMYILQLENIKNKFSFNVIIKH